MSACLYFFVCLYALRVCMRACVCRRVGPHVVEAASLPSSCFRSGPATRGRGRLFDLAARVHADRRRRCSASLRRFVVVVVFKFCLFVSATYFSSSHCYACLASHFFVFFEFLHVLTPTFCRSTCARSLYVCARAGLFRWRALPTSDTHTQARSRRRSCWKLCLVVCKRPSTRTPPRVCRATATAMAVRSSRCCTCLLCPPACRA